MAYEQVGLEAQFRGGAQYISQLKDAAHAEDAVAKGAQNAATHTQALGRQASSTGSMLRMLTKLAVPVALTGMAAGAIKAGFGFNALKEQAMVAFTSMTGSGEKAKAFMDDLAHFAATTPFEFPDLIRTSQSLVAMGYNASEVIPMLTDIGDAVAAMGGSPEILDRVTRAFTQMKAKGKVSAEEMRQLAEAGIPAWQYLADAAGTSVAQVMKAAENGSLEANKSIMAIRQGMRTQFGGMMEEQSHTFQGMLSTVKDELRFFAADATKPLFDMAKAGLSRLIEILTDPAFKEATAAISAGIADAINGIASVIGSLLPDLKLIAGGMLEFGMAIEQAGAAVLDKLSPAFDTVRVFLGEHPEVKIGALSGAVAVLAIALSAMALSAIAAVAPLLLLVGTAAVIGAGIALLIVNWDAFTKAVEPFTTHLGPSIAYLMGSINDSLDTLRPAFEDIGKALRDNQPLWEFLGKVIGGSIIVALEGMIRLLGVATRVYATELAAALHVAAAAINALGIAFEWLSDHVGDVLKMWDAVIQFFVDLPGTIVDAIGDLGQAFFSIAEDAMNGFLDGLASKWDDVKGWFGSHLDPRNINIPGRSPLVDAWEHTGEDAGTAFGDGLTSSLVAYMPQIQATAQSIVNSIQSIFGGAATTYGAGSYDVIEAAAARAAATGVSINTAVGQVGGAPTYTPSTAKGVIPKLDLGTGTGKGGGAGKDKGTSLGGFLAAVTDAAQMAQWEKAFGKLGADLMESLGKALEDNSDASGEALQRSLDKMIQDAKDAGVPNAATLGEQLMAAVTEGLKTGSMAGVAELLPLFKQGGELTIGAFQEAFTKFATETALEKALGSKGKSMFDALNKAIKEGSQKNIDAMGDYANQIAEELKDKLSERDAGMAGAKFMSALGRAIQDKSPEALAAFQDTMSKINVILEGGIVNWENGTVILAKDVKKMADMLGMATEDVVKNWELLSTMGLGNILAGQRAMTEATKQQIAEIVDAYQRGFITIAAAKQQSDRVLAQSGGYTGKAPNAPLLNPGAGTLGMNPNITGVELTALSNATGIPAGILLGMTPTQINSAIYGGNLGPNATGYGGIDPTSNLAAILGFGYNATSGQFDLPPNPNPKPAGQSIATYTYTPPPAHALGLDWVPYDNYLALLHRGEAVVPAWANRAAMPGMPSPAGRGNVELTIDMRGAQLTGTIQENEAMMRRVVRDEVQQHITGDAWLTGGTRTRG